MNPIWFLRMAKWARRPPSTRTVLLWGAVIVFCLVLVLIELVFGWPEALQVNQGGSPRPRITAP